MRILIAGFNLESVTFLPNPTTLDEFERVAKRGEDLLSSFENTNTVPGGFIKACKNEGLSWFHWSIQRWAQLRLQQMKPLTTLLMRLPAELERNFTISMQCS
ncbi:MAG: hypothetical protein CM15mP62_30360 [Rhodospirillaceae bacterium]|nr:MAG: hypothetical protein CM15mP62_30360 [Rhodospirillaceae bacterium]